MGDGGATGERDDVLAVQSFCVLEIEGKREWGRERKETWLL